MHQKPDINSMEIRELVTYGRNELGLDVSMRMKPETVKSLIADALGTENVAVAPVAEAMGTRRNRFSNAVAASKVTVDNDVDWDDQVVINIAESRDNPHPVPVTVNGYTLLIGRGVNVAVPRAYALVLQNAVEDDISQDPDSGEMSVRKVTAYPFSYVQPAPH